MRIINGISDTPVIDPDDTFFHQSVHSTTMPLPTITSPTIGETGISVTPTIVTKEGVSNLYSFYTRATSDVTGIVIDTDLVYNQFSDTDIPLNTTTGVFTLPAHYEFELTGAPNLTAFTSAAGFVYFDWVLAADNSVLPNAQSGSIIPSTFASNAGSQPQAKAVIRTTTATEVKLRTTTFLTGTCTFSMNNSWATIHATTTAHHDYTQSYTQIEIRSQSSGIVVYSSGDVASLSVNVSPALTLATIYELRTRHKHLEGYYTRWSVWQAFTTA
jgi:hypothetical protein